jgi:hypothetical protein
VQPRRERRQAEVGVQGGLVQDLGHVAQVRHQAFAVRLREQAFLQPEPHRDRLEQGGDPSVGEHPAPAAQLQAQLVELAPLDERGGVEPDEPADRETADPCRAVRLLQGLEQPLPLLGRRRREHAGPPGHDRRDARRPEPFLHGDGLGVGAHDDGDVAGVQRPLVPLGAGVAPAVAQHAPAGQQRDHLPGARPRGRSPAPPWRTPGPSG